MRLVSRIKSKFFALKPRINFLSPVQSGDFNAILKAINGASNSSISFTNSIDSFQLSLRIFSKSISSIFLSKFLFRNAISSFEYFKSQSVYYDDFLVHLKQRRVSRIQKILLNLKVNH